MKYNTIITPNPRNTQLIVTNELIKIIINH